MEASAMSSAMRSERTRARRAQNGAGACLSGRSRSLGARRVRWASPHTRLSRICSSAAAIVVFAGSGWGGSVAVVVTVLAIVLRRPPSQVRPPPMPCVSSRVVGAADLHSCTVLGMGRGVFLARPGSRGDSHSDDLFLSAVFETSSSVAVDVPIRIVPGGVLRRAARLAWARPSDRAG